MKKLMALVTALLLICTLAGCGGAPVKKPAEQDTLALLRQEIADSGSQCGVAYLGYMQNGDDVSAWLVDNGWTQTFPFLSDLTETQVVTQEGGEVYCIVPAEKNAHVTVEAYDAFNETDPLGDVLYDSTDGAPICLRGNVSEIMGNLRVTVDTAAGQAVYFPSLSLRDGSVSTLTEKGSVYNFTPGAIHGAPQIRELYSEDFDYTDSVGNTGHYTYRVPQLEADTEGAVSINRGIEREYGPFVEEALACRDDGDSISCAYIVWETYQYGDILSLVMTCAWDNDMNQYSVYLYDTANGTRLTTAELLAQMGVDETAFLAAVRQAAAERFDGNYAGITGDFDDFLAERRAWTLSDDNINIDVMVAYPDENGQLHVVLPIGSIAGADAYEEWLTPELGAVG